MNAYYLKKLQEELKNSGFSAILISPGEELKFLLGFEPLFCERFQGLFVKADGSCFYVCNLLYEEEFKQALRESSAVVDRVFEEVLPMIKPGVTEKEIGDFLLKRMTELGGGCAECIVGVGPNSAYPHYNDNKGVIREHDIVLMDYGCTIRGMYSDMTRTVFVGEPDEKGYAWSLVNRLGHGVGYTIHEAPDIKRSNPVHLERGMAFTIEPGIYLAGAFGVRVEDMVVINEKGEREILNHATKDLIVL